MVAASLTNEMMDSGKDLVLELDKAEVGLDAAFWIQSFDEGSWKLALSFPEVKAEGPRAAYTQVQKALFKINKPTLLSDIMVLSPDNAWLQLVRRLVRVGPNVAAIRLTGNVVNGVRIPDAFVYRMLAPLRRSSDSSSSSSSSGVG